MPDILERSHWLDQELGAGHDVRHAKEAFIGTVDPFAFLECWDNIAKDCRTMVHLAPEM